MLDQIMAPAANNFALLRLIAAVCVVISHAVYLWTGETAAQPLATVTRYNLGQHAVHVFFVLSGVMVAGSLDRASSLLSFAVARVLRIVPGLILCVGLTTLALGPMVTDLSFKAYFSDPETYVHLLRTATLTKISAPLPGVFETLPVPEALNEPLWTLKYELLCYALLAALSTIGAWRTDHRFIAVLCASLLICVPLVLTWPSDPEAATAPFHLARFWLCFLLGAAFYRYRADIRLSWTGLAILALVWWLGRSTPVEPFLTFVLAGYGALVLAAVPLRTLREFTNRTDLSYGIYIYGWPTSQTLLWAFPGISLPAAIALSILGAASLGCLSWTLVERPSLRTRAKVIAALRRLRRRQPLEPQGVASA
jgi:peptidoglycan/LPS O-acetylase OafA/YrhL